MTTPTAAAVAAVPVRVPPRHRPDVRVMTTTVSCRDVAILRAVRAGRALLVCGRVPDVLIDGRWCSDQTAAHALCAAGFITPVTPARPGARVAGVLTRAGWAALATAAVFDPKLSRPGGMSLDSLRRVGSPITHDASGEDPMLTITNPDCLALGCDWDWGMEPCGCGRPHTFRICARCLVSDDPECDTDTDDAVGVDGAGVAA